MEELIVEPNSVWVQALTVLGNLQNLSDSPLHVSFSVVSPADGDPVFVLMPYTIWPVDLSTVSKVVWVKNVSRRNIKVVWG